MQVHAGGFGPIRIGPMLPSARLAALAVLAFFGGLPVAASAADAAAITSLGKTSANSEFLPPDEAFKVSAEATAADRVEVTSLNAERHVATFKTQCFVGDTVVIDGEATLMVPRRKLA